MLIATVIAGPSLFGFLIITSRTNIPIIPTTITSTILTTYVANNSGRAASPIIPYVKYTADTGMAIKKETMNIATMAGPISVKPMFSPPLFINIVRD